MDVVGTLKRGVTIRANLNFEDVKNIVSEYYGFEVVTVVELNGYDDRNYHVIVEKNKEFDNRPKEFVLKVINSLDSKKPQIFEAQDLLMLHLCENGVRCPQVILTRKGLNFEKIRLKSGEHIIRLLEFIHGPILHNISCTPSLFYQVGEIISKADVALKNFHHPAYIAYKSVWQLESVPELSQFTYAVTNDKRRELVETIIAEFEIRVLSIADKLEKGMIHGDVNEQNIIVEEVNGDFKIKAILDFGDVHFTCYLFELAITMLYMMLEAKDIEAGGYVLAGYSSVREVPIEEYSLLKICIAARLCQSLVLGAYSNLQDPENEYVLTTAATGWTWLEQFWNEPEDELLEKWKTKLF